MSFSKQRIIDEFNLKPFGARGWMRSDQLVCPNCGQSDEFSIKFTEDSAVMHCLHSKSCNNYSTSLYNYLKGIGKLDLITYEKTIKLDEFPDFSEPNEVIEENSELPLRKPPIGFRRLNHDEYLEGRNFQSEHYELFQVGNTKLNPSLKNHLIFQFFNEKDECIAWMSRSKRDKKWHDENLRKFKLGLCSLHLRYNNSPDTDFGRILGGVSEITENTDTLIIAEGLFDKVNVDTELGLLYDKTIKCLFTFGNKISVDQINLINKFENIKNIYLMYDEGTTKQSKQGGLLILSNTNKNIMVCDIKQEGLDPGDMSVDQLIEIMEGAINGFEFYYSKIDGVT